MLLHRSKQHPLNAKFAGFVTEGNPASVPLLPFDGRGRAVYLVASWSIRSAAG
jgi:hypothetical protein